MYPCSNTGYEFHSAHNTTGNVYTYTHRGGMLAKAQRSAVWKKVTMKQDEIESTLLFLKS